MIFWKVFPDRFLLSHALLVRMKYFLTDFIFKADIIGDVQICS